ncbi:hypothetical protein [Stomatohabitans albus]|uniref:hypothetical protein n=1 Tax=Stomatohabitans albus TaxID=3110766 RepID=UPI00300D3177
MGRLKNARKKGVAFETAIVTAARAFGLVARRLAEGGHADEGDLELWAATGQRIVVEAKSTATLSPQAVLTKATVKARAHGHTGPVALVWKRATVKPGNTRASPDGPPLVIMPMVDWLMLISPQERQRE